MAETAHKDFYVELVFTKRRNGRFYVHSPTLPGLHLAGSDIDLIRADIEPIVKDLLRHNAGIPVDEIQWVPPLDQISTALKDQMPPTAPRPGKPTRLVIVGRAA
jgi:hypothetical protein